MLFIALLLPSRSLLFAERDGDAPHGPGARRGVYGAACPPATGTPGAYRTAQHPVCPRSCFKISATSHGRVIAIEGHLQDIAAEIGMTREALYRSLAALEADGVCEPHGECDSVEEIR